MKGTRWAHHVTEGSLLDFDISKLKTTVPITQEINYIKSEMFWMFESKAICNQKDSLQNWLYIIKFVM